MVAVCRSGRPYTDSFYVTAPSPMGVRQGHFFFANLDCPTPVPSRTVRPPGSGSGGRHAQEDLVCLRRMVVREGDGRGCFSEREPVRDHRAQ
ncbi:MAG: hypothetical protein RL022_2991 [Chloroflexota bacterium]